METGNTVSSFILFLTYCVRLKNKLLDSKVHSKKEKSRII